MRIVRLGEAARIALVRSRGIARPLPAFPDAPYLEAAGEIIWVGMQLPALHPRAVLTAQACPRGTEIRFDSIPDRGWSPQLRVLDPASGKACVAAANKLRAKLAQDHSVRGFGTLFAGRAPAFPLDIAVPRVKALCEAYARNDAHAATQASIALFGLGSGLTPSGDDLAGAALFGRRLLMPDDPGWSAAAETLMREIATRSHAISAALFGDLARGQSFAPLHAIADALAANDDTAALAAALTLAAIGHSSGWDMLTGLIIGISGIMDR